MISSEGTTVSKTSRMVVKLKLALNTEAPHPPYRQKERKEKIKKKNIKIEKNYALV